MGSVVNLVVVGGLPAVTVEAVSSRSGVAKTTIYRHWSSREDLLADVLSSALPEPAVPDTGSLRGDLRALARGLAAGLADERCAALLSAIAFPDGDPVLDRVRMGAPRARPGRVRLVVDRGAPCSVSVSVSRSRGVASMLMFT